MSEGIRVKHLIRLHGVNYHPFHPKHAPKEIAHYNTPDAAHAIPDDQLTKDEAEKLVKQGAIEKPPADYKYAKPVSASLVEARNQLLVDAALGRLLDLAKKGQLIDGQPPAAKV